MRKSKSKSPIIKIGGYIIISFFVLLIIMSFGMPKISQIFYGTDASNIAEVNGEQVTRHELIDALKEQQSYKRRRIEMINKTKPADAKEYLLTPQEKNYVLDSLIYKKLKLQKCKEYGIKVSDYKTSDIVKQYFRDKNGKFDKKYFEIVLANKRMSQGQFLAQIKDSLTIAKLESLFDQSAAVSSEEIAFENAIDKSQYQIKYAFLPNLDFRKDLPVDQNISAKEIEEEMKKNPDEIKDPKTDRERFKKKLLRDRQNLAKKEYIDSLNKLVNKGDSFEDIAKKMKAKINQSKVFKIGENIQSDEKQPKNVSDLSRSTEFSKQLVLTEIGKSSKIIETRNGLYVFTPLKKEFKIEDVNAEESKKIENKMLNEIRYLNRQKMYQSLQEKSKIIRNLDFTKIEDKK